MLLKELFEEKAPISDDVKEKYKRWRELVNMPSDTLKKFLGTETGQEAGLRKKEAEKLGIGTGRESARAILRMREKPLSEWDKTDISWMGRQLSFIARMSGNSGPMVKKDKDGKDVPTRKLTSLWVWGHVPKGYPPGKFGVFK